MSRWKGTDVLEYTDGCRDSLVVALGFFDCLHVGHIKLIERAKLLAFKNSAKCAVFTFCNDPFEVLRCVKKEQILNFEERVKKLNFLRVEYCLKTTFDSEFSKLSPEEYLDKLLDNTSIKGIVVGDDYTFGRGGKGDVELLKSKCLEKNIQLEVVPFAMDNGEKISSSKIRSLLLDGDIELANKYLGQPYFIDGEVVHGMKRGRNIGFATANLTYPSDKLKIKSGVYYTKVFINGVWLKAVTNVGDRPTFDEKDYNIESHILFYKDDLYGKKITISFLQRIRDIQKFTAKEELAERISLDVEFALKSKL